MTPGTEQARGAEPRMGSERPALAWVDALVSGNCTAEEFLAAVRNQFQGELEETWEVLSLLDQYYRRGKIKADLFLWLKSQLEGPVVDGDEMAATVAARLAEGSRPRPSPTVVTTPVTAAQQKAPQQTAPHRTAPQQTAPQQSASQRTASQQAAPQQTAPQRTGSHQTTPQQMAPQRTASQQTASQQAASQRTASQQTTPQQPTAPPDSHSAASREVAIGDVLRGRYRVVGVLGHGGMGSVFEAVDEYRVDLPSVSQRLAVKVLHTAVAHREELLSELQREFQHLQLLSHPNVVRVHEFDRDGDIAFFTMEFLDGTLLSQVLGARKSVALPRPYALAIMRDIGAALAHAHSRGVVHGDVNPQNIFITNSGELRVLDFGASHKMRRDRWTADGRLSDRAPVATLGYASCQLLEGQYPDARDDTFAFACVAYVLLSGKHPFPNRSALEACAQRLHPPRPPGITSQQWRILREGLRWERERRPSDVQEWLDRFDLAGAARRLPRLSELVRSPPPRNPKFLRTAAMVVVIALLAAGGYWTVTNVDSLQRRVAEWSGRSQPAADTAAKLPAAPVPAVTDQTSSPPLPRAAPAAAPPPAAPRTTQLSPTSQPTPTSRPTSIAPPARAAHAAPALAADRRAAAVARSSVGGTSARAGDGGPTHIELAADTVDVAPSDTAAHVVVLRKGNLHGDANFTWWTESGTAKPNRDFEPVTPRAEQIADGSSTAVLTIPVSSSPRTRPKSFYVVIDRTDSGPALGTRTLTMVTLQPPD